MQDLKRKQMLANDVLRYAKRIITDDQIETPNGHVRILVLESENGDLYYIRRMTGTVYDVINLSQNKEDKTRWHIYKINE